MNHVYVAGSINMDVVATAARYPKMGETVPGREIFFFPGGKGGNQAVSAAKLGAPTTLIGCLGQDAFDRELSTFLSAQGIDLTNVRYRSALVLLAPFPDGGQRILDVLLRVGIGVRVKNLSLGRNYIGNAIGVSLYNRKAGVYTLGSG
jgi:sugar/nucleoside kinase (ribokinase family)